MDFDHHDESGQTRAALHDVHLTLWELVPYCARVRVRPYPTVIKDDGFLICPNHPPTEPVTLNEMQEECGQFVIHVCDKRDSDSSYIYALQKSHHRRHAGCV